MTASSYTSLPQGETYTADRALEAAGMGRFQYLLLVLTGLCWTAESMEMLLLSFIKLPLQCAWGITDAQASLVTTAVGVGMLTGSTAWGLLADAAGRRVVFIASTAVTFLLGLASAAAPSYWFLVLSRGLVGFGIGGIPVSYSLLMEFLPAAQRGTWGMAVSFFWSAGAIFESFIALLVLPAFGWRALIAVSTFPLLIVLVLSFFIKESPRWLVARGRLEDAQSVIQDVAATNRSTLPRGTLVSSPATEGGWRELFKPGARFLLFNVFVMWFACAFLYYGVVMLQPELIAQESAGKRCAQYGPIDCPLLKQTDCFANARCRWNGASCTSINAARFYLAYGITPSSISTTAAGHPNSLSSPPTTPPLSTYTRESPDDIKKQACATQLTRKDFVSTLVSSLGELPGVFIAIVLVDIIGRRPLIGYKFAITSVLLIILLACVGRAAETAIFFVVRGASTGAFQSTYLFTNEIYPARIRGLAMGVSSSVARVGLILTPLVSQYLSNISLPSALWTYFAVGCAAVCAVFLTPIETTGRPLLESMDELVTVLKGETVDTQGNFAKDPGVSWLVRLFRWNAAVDGGATAALPG